MLEQVDRRFIGQSNYGEKYYSDNGSLMLENLPEDTVRVYSPKYDTRKLLTVRCKSLPQEVMSLLPNGYDT